MSDRRFRIGEVYWMEFDGIGSEQKGCRPGIVFQNNLGNSVSPNLIALPITKSAKKKNQPTHVFLRASTTGLPMDSMVLCENPQRMSKERVKGFITKLSDETIGEIAAANLIATSAIAFINPSLLYRIWNAANSLNSYQERASNNV